MTSFVDLWLICCGIAGILIAVTESRRSQPRTMIIATVAWAIILMGTVLTNQKVESTHRSVQANQVRLDAAAELVREVKDDLRRRQDLEDDRIRRSVPAEDVVPLPRPPNETGGAEK